MLQPLLAAAAPEDNTLLWIMLGIISACIVTFWVAMVLFLQKTYKRCPSNRVLVIYGRTGEGGAARCVHGGAAFVIPLIQDYAYLSLEPIQIEIPLRGALSMENIRVNVPSVFAVAIGTEPVVMQRASIRLLGLSIDEIRKQAEQIIFSQFRQVVASMGIEQIIRDQNTLLMHIQRLLEPELMKIGLMLINVNITDVTDDSGYIDAMGEKVLTAALLRKLAAFDGSAQRLVAHLLGEGKLNEEDRQEIRRLLDASSSPP